MQSSGADDVDETDSEELGSLEVNMNAPDASGGSTALLHLELAIHEQVSRRGTLNQK